MKKRILYGFLVSMILSFLMFPTISPSQSNITATNKKLVTDFYTLAFVNNQVQEAFDKYVGDSYVQHNPEVADGKAAAIEFISKLIKDNPKGITTIKRVIAEGDFVVIHQHSYSPEDRGVAVIDIFRVDKGKIVEHWDVIQAVPEKSANNNTMF